MKKIRQYLIPIMLGLVVLLGSLWIGRFKILAVYYRHKFNQSSPETQFAQYEKEFMEDRKILGEYDIFRPSRGTKDAGPFLNSKIHWEIGDIHHQGSLVLPEFVKREMNKDWVLKKPLFKKMGLKFDWMKELRKYDYWNPEENSPAFPAGKKYLTYSYPIPSYMDLITWAKLRLLHGKETNDIQAAFKEVRHLMRLIWTNDYLVSTMVVPNMLKLEHSFHETLLPEQEGDWKLVPEDVIMRAKRHFYDLQGMTDIRFSDKMFQKATSTDVGLCSMVLEGMMGLISMRDMMKEELAERYRRMDKLVTSSQTKCRKTIVHKMWEDPSWPSFMSDSQDAFAYVGNQTVLGKKLTWKELKESHELKVVMGYVLLNAAPPRILKSYEKN
jgi:hypothetical protein